MSLSHLNIHHVRNISSLQLTLNPQFNLIYGPNGSGKTSLLESIYLLSSGHSFRTREFVPLIKQGEDALTVFARTIKNETVSIQKTLTKETRVKLNQQPCQRSSDLARFLPCQVFYQDIFQIIDAGPSVRRSLLDWGLFHVKQSYHLLWKEYRHVLKQRNALLRQRASQSQFLPWDKLLVDLSYELDQLRELYFDQWAESFQLFLKKLTDVPCSIYYYKGWDKRKSHKSLDIILGEQFHLDQQTQYTHSGAHQADLYFESDSSKSKQILSRGQQKIVLMALKLAQAQLIERPCIYLFDDMAAELDSEHLQKLISCLSSIRGQFFITSLGLPDISGSLHKDEFSEIHMTEGVSRETNNDIQG